MINWDTYQFARFDWERSAAVMLDEPESDSIEINGYTINISPEGKKSVSVKVENAFLGASGDPVGLVDLFITFFDEKEENEVATVCDILNAIFYNYESKED